MWCPEGYTTVYEISVFLTDEAFDWADDLPLPDEQKADAAWAYRKWYLMQLFRCFGDDIRACLPSGANVHLTRSAFGWTYPNDDDFDDALSKVRVVCPQDPKMLERINARRFLYLDEHWLLLLREGEDTIAVSPFYPIGGASLCIHSALLPPAEQTITEWLHAHAQHQEETADGDASSISYRDLPSMIVEAYSKGHVSRRDEARRMFGRHMKTDAWRAVWAEAVRLNPAMSRPGPRPTR